MLIKLIESRILVYYRNKSVLTALLISNFIEYGYAMLKHGIRHVQLTLIDHQSTFVKGSNYVTHQESSIS